MLVLPSLLHILLVCCLPLKHECMICFFTFFHSNRNRNPPFTHTHNANTTGRNISSFPFFQLGSRNPGLFRPGVLLLNPSAGRLDRKVHGALVHFLPPNFHKKNLPFWEALSFGEFDKIKALVFGCCSVGDDLSWKDHLHFRSNVFNKSGILGLK